MVSVSLFAIIELPLERRIMGKKAATSAKSGGLSNTPAQHTDRTGKQKVLLDWVGFTFLSEEFSIGAALEVFEKLLGIPIEAWNNGRRHYEGYANSKNFENINIYYEGASDQGIHVDITGQGCRFIEVLFQKLRIPILASKSVVREVEDMDWNLFLSYIDSMDTKFTRIDVALDDFSETFTVPYIFQKLLKGEVRMKFKSWSPDGYFGADGQAKAGMTLYFGSDVSRIQVVMYEKAKQLGRSDEKWTRTEIRFKHERANEFIKLFLAQNETENFFEMGVIAAAILKDYITFLDTNPKDSNKWRWKVSPFWEDFLKGIKPLKLASALPDRSILKTRQWIDKSISKSFATLFFAYQGINDQWLREVFDEGKKKLTIRELQMIEEFRRTFESEVAATIDGAIETTGYTKANEEMKNTRRAGGPIDECGR